MFIFGVVIHVFEECFVHGRFADHVFFAGPGAEVEEIAAFAAERKFGARVRIRGLFADGAAVLHMLRIPQIVERCAGRWIVLILTAGTACRAPTDSNNQWRCGVDGTGRSSSADVAAKAIAA